MYALTATNEFMGWILGNLHPDGSFRSLSHLCDKNQIHQIHFIAWRTKVLWGVEILMGVRGQRMALPLSQQRNFTRLKLSRRPNK